MKTLAYSLVFCSVLASCTSDRESSSSTEPPWPAWALEHWVWEDESTQASATALVEGYLERDIPVSAIIIDSPWATGYSTFEWDTSRYPDPQGMIDHFHDLGVRVFLWTVPGINEEVTELFEHAASHGYFMTKAESSTEPGVVSWWKGRGALIDYFNPEAVAWWESLVDKSLAYGIDGWKTDGMDYHMLLGARYSPGAGRIVQRDEYSAAYYRHFFDYTRAVLGDDRIITSRPIDNYGLDSGDRDYAFTPKDILWAGWVGDQDATFNGLSYALNNMYHSANFGYVNFGSDIGGYREDDAYPQGRGKELLIRWAQLGALSPVMENGGGGNHEPWAFDEETVDIYREFTKLHHALVPYLMREGGLAFAEGRSLMSFTRREDYSYLLGADIFVAPMLESGTQRTVHFPDGDWIYLFNPAKSFEGTTTRNLEIPLNEFPVFLRSGSSIARTLLR